MTVIQSIISPVVKSVVSPVVVGSGSAPAPDSLLTDLVAWWSLDEASGTRVNAHNPGTYDLTDNNTVGSTTGVVGNAATFVDTASENLSVASCPLDLTLDWTVAGWFAGTSINSDAWWGTGSASATGLAIVSADRIQLSVRGNNAVSYTTALLTVTGGYASLIPIICTYTASTRNAVMTINDDQTQEVTLPEGVTPAAGTIFVLGSRAIASAFCTGSIDEVALAQRVWTAEEQTRFCAGMAYPG